MTREALLEMLHMMIDKPITLALFANVPMKGANLSEFRRPPNCHDITLSRSDWAVNPATVQANGNKQTFKFSDRAGKVQGYVLALAGTGVVLDYKRFVEPYPINSSDDEISVTPRLRLEGRQD